MKTDSEILAALHEGSPEAFEFVYKRMHTKIFLVARKYANCDDDANDIRSICFIKLWELRNKLQFESLGGVYNWLRLAAINCSIDHIRHTTYVESKEESVLSNYLYDHEDELFEANDKEALILDRLMNEMERLPLKQREVFKMRWLRDLKFREIAEELHTDVSTIKKRYARAVMLLRKSINLNQSIYEKNNNFLINPLLIALCNSY